MKMNRIDRHKQRGAVLAIALIMMVLITLMVTSAFRMSSTNLQAVGNFQFRSQALAAADVAIERMLGLVTFPTGGVDEPVDINRDGSNEYQVNVVRSCLRADPVVGTGGLGTGSSVTLGFTAVAKEYIGLLEYDATVSDPTTGTFVRVKQGVRQRMSQAECDSICPPGPLLNCN